MAPPLPHTHRCTRSCTFRHTLELPNLYGCTGICLHAHIIHTHREPQILPQLLQAQFLLYFLQEATSHSWNGRKIAPKIYFYKPWALWSLCLEFRGQPDPSPLPSQQRNQGAITSTYTGLLNVPWLESSTSPPSNWVLERKDNKSHSWADYSSRDENLRSGGIASGKKRRCSQGPKPHKCGQLLPPRTLQW
jgi:hypothetical protein